MSFFQSNQKKTSEENVVATDILSQVRIMGEKNPSAQAQGTSNGGVVSNQNQNQQNPLSNPFIHADNSALPPQAAIPTPTSTPPAPAPSPAVPSTTESFFKPAPTGQNQQNVTTFGSPVTNPNIKKEIEILDRRDHSSKVIIIGSILTIALVLIMGIFFYLEKVKDAKMAAEQDRVNEQATATIPEEETTEPELATAVFSLDRSNYLSLDTETATRDTFLAQIKENGSKIQEASIKSPVSFQVTDENNIPLAFNRFVFLMDLKIPETLLSSLDEDFGVVLYDDGGQMRMGMTLKFKEEMTTTPQELLSPLETSLPQAFAPLFYPSDIVLPTEIIFGTGAYNNATVRYSNVAPDRMYSFDYILQDKLLYVGNSKEATRKTFEFGVR
jgi:flagellar basal body-associated protein FliL